jgi:methionyl-tRNA formyltransferase
MGIVDRRVRIVFFGNSHSHFSNRFFQALTATSGELVGLVDTPSEKRGSTNPLSGRHDNLLQQAERMGVPVFEPDQPNETNFVETIRALSPDLFLAVGYTSILHAPILQVPRVLAANFHASLLPAYRGKHPVFWCLRNGERWSGLTVHVMDAGIDTGDILYQVKVSTRKNDSVSSLYERITEHSLPLVARIVEETGRGMIRRRPQEQAGASYYSSISEKDFRIDWKAQAETIRRWISTSPGECFAQAGKEKIHFLEAEVVRLPAGKLDGEVCEIGRKWGIIGTGEGGLRVRNVRLNEGEILTFKQWCSRVGLRVGMQIGAIDQE